MRDFFQHSQQSRLHTAPDDPAAHQESIDPPRLRSLRHQHGGRNQPAVAKTVLHPRPHGNGPGVDHLLELGGSVTARRQVELVGLAHQLGHSRQGALIHPSHRQRHVQPGEKLLQGARLLLQSLPARIFLIKRRALPVLSRQGQEVEAAALGQRANVAHRARRHLQHRHHRQLLPHPLALHRIVIKKHQGIQANVKRRSDAAKAARLVFPMHFERGKMRAFDEACRVMVEHLFHVRSVVLARGRQQDAAVAKRQHPALKIQKHIARIVRPQRNAIASHLAQHPAPQRVVHVQHQALLGRNEPGAHTAGHRLRHRHAGIGAPWGLGQVFQPLIAPAIQPGFTRQPRRIQHLHVRRPSAHRRQILIEPLHKARLRRAQRPVRKPRCTPQRRHEITHQYLCLGPAAQSLQQRLHPSAQRSALLRKPLRRVGKEARPQFRQPVLQSRHNNDHVTRCRVQEPARIHHLLFDLPIGRQPQLKVQLPPGGLNHQARMQEIRRKTCQQRHLQPVTRRCFQLSRQAQIIGSADGGGKRWQFWAGHRKRGDDQIMIARIRCTPTAGWRSTYKPKWKTGEWGQRNEGVLFCEPCGAARGRQ